MVLVPAEVLRGIQSQVEELRAALQDAREGQESILQIVQDLQAQNTALSRELEDKSNWLKELEENQFIQAKLIADLRKGREPQPMQKDRGEILRALLVANGGKMMAKDARQKMRLSRSRFSELLATMADEIDVKPFHLRRSQRVLILK
ncbi:MAG: hypothetical protein A4E48_00082 [Methanosaeta sp. PtaU1.Bin060]|nr:MAG: hypothetical protein A4E48_00082 [Methanosaeta sp. PtaU1.Bin060]